MKILSYSYCMCSFSNGFIQLCSALCLAFLLFVSAMVFPVQAASITEAQLKNVLLDNWNQYKTRFIQADGRVIDYNGNVTTSEGQSYAMFRAFWMRDKATFDKTYRWAKDNLQIPRGDHLFSWKWGEKPDKTWGALDKTSASDADQDIAFALLLGYKEWKDPAYLDDSKLILNDIWTRLTLDAPIGRVLLPGDWPQKGRTYQINPSYFAPYAYRVFAEVDTDHDWTALTDSSYEILTRAVAQSETHLPPDWVQISLDNDQVTLYQDPLDPRSDFGYEAIRVYWRIALDSLMVPLEKRATGLLKTRNLLPRYWKIRKDLPISITWDGIVRHPEIESGAIYGAVLPSLYAQDKDAAEDMVARRILPNLKPGGQWNTKNDYYPQNWLWSGLALYTISLDPPDYTRSSALLRLATLLQLKPAD
jgi:endo-1,4-beta-D-glucanase Y